MARRVPAAKPSTSITIIPQGRVPSPIQLSIPLPRRFPAAAATLWPITAAGIAEPAVAASRICQFGQGVGCRDAWRAHVCPGGTACSARHRRRVRGNRSVRDGREGAPRGRRSDGGGGQGRGGGHLVGYRFRNRRGALSRWHESIDRQHGETRRARAEAGALRPFRRAICLCGPAGLRDGASSAPGGVASGPTKTAPSTAIGGHSSWPASSGGQRLSCFFFLSPALPPCWCV